MIRVLHYGLGTNLGGIERYLLDLSKALHGSSAHFSFVYNDVGEPCFKQELNELGCQFYPLPPRRESPRRNSQELHRLLNRTRFDVLHAHMNTLSYLSPVLVAQKRGIKSVVHSHNAGVSRSWRTRVLHALNSRRLPSDVHRVAVSDPAGRWLFGNAPFKTLHNGIDTHTFAFDPLTRNEIRGRLDIGPEKLVLGHIGAFIPAKNHEFLLKVHRQVLKQEQGAILLMIGSGPLEQDLRQLATSLGISDQVRMLGQRSDIPAILSALDVMVFPSLHEGLPLALIEAQASGLPCIVSDHVTPEIRILPSCQLMPLDQPEDWANEILRHRGIGDRRPAASIVASSGFELRDTTRQIRDLYTGLAGR